jgi:hypothetical protein
MKTILLAGFAAVFLASTPAWVGQPTNSDRFQLAEDNGTQTRVAGGNGTVTHTAKANLITRLPQPRNARYKVRIPFWFMRL